MLPAVSQEDILLVSDLHTEVTSIKYHRRKKDRFIELTQALPENAKWLLTFCCWNDLRNTRFTPIEASRYYAAPSAKTTTASFLDFIKVLQKFEHRKVVAKQEGTIINFLSKCDRKFQDFYLLLLSKKFIINLPKLEMNQELELADIKLEDVYAPIELLKTEFCNLSYPVTISGVNSLELQFRAVVKSDRTSTGRIYDFKSGKYRQSSNLLGVDEKFIKAPKFAMSCFMSDDKTLYPVDYFHSSEEFHAAKWGNPGAPEFKERISNLHEFQRMNLLQKVSFGHVGFAENEEQLWSEIHKVTDSVDYKYLLFTDQNTIRNGRSFAVEPRRTVGIIEELWVEDGEAKGFIIHFNGKLSKCTFSFVGKNNAILNSPKVAWRKLIEFIHIQIGDFIYLSGYKIHWRTKPFRAGTMGGTVYEKCCLCGNPHTRHKNRGVCHDCECNLYKYFRKYGVNQWIQPKNVMKRKRYKSCWVPYLLNCCCTHEHMGLYYLEAREDGCWRFVEKG